MKTKKNRRRPTGRTRKAKRTTESLRSLAAITLCAFLAIVIAVGSKVVAGDDEKNQVYAASSEDGSVPTGIAGMISGVQETPAPGTTVNRIGTSCENVMVGQRVKTVKDSVTSLNISSAMEAAVINLEEKSISLASTPKIMSDTDYETLLAIVEAEAGTEDVKGRVLVANVIMNRIAHEEFPDTVTEVVWDYSNGVPQFSPTYDGRIGTVTVSEETREAVKQALEGVDYSEGALFFIQKSAAEDHNVKWFEKDLKKLFKYGCHEFYTYPDE